MEKLPHHLDIHLIRVLYMLLSEKSVSRVAAKLNQPQPSISALLRKLREMTGDPLLVRGGHGMVPTRHGESLLLPAKRILMQTERLFAQQLPFAAQEESRIFRIGAPDYLDTRFLPRVIASVHRQSPGSRIVIQQISHDTDYVRLLSDSGLDLVIGNWDDPPAHLHLSHLFQDPIICAMHAETPYARRTGEDEMTVEDYLSLPHVAPAAILPGYHGFIDAYLEKHNMQRNIVVESPYFSQMPYIVAQTNLVLTTGRQFLDFHVKNLPLKTFTVPIRFPPMRFYQLWHGRVHKASEHQWLRGLVSAVAKDMLLVPQPEPLALLKASK